MFRKDRHYVYHCWIYFYSWKFNRENVCEYVDKDNLKNQIKFRASSKLALTKEKRKNRKNKYKKFNPKYRVVAIRSASLIRRNRRAKET
jgi:hypothetical protein